MTSDATGPAMTLVFNLSDPDQERAGRVALDGERYRAALQDLDDWLREGIKYRDMVAWEPVREALHEILQERGLSLDDA